MNTITLNKYNLTAIVLGAVALITRLLCLFAAESEFLYDSGLSQSWFLSALLIGVLVCLLVGNKEKMVFPNKRGYFIATVVFCLAASKLVNDFTYIFSGTHVLNAIRFVLSFIGLALFFASFFFRGHWRWLSAASLGLLLVSRLLSIPNLIYYDDPSSLLSLIMSVVILGLFIVMTLGLFENIAKILRNVTVALLIVSVFLVSQFQWAEIPLYYAFFALAFLLVPGKKIVLSKIDMSGFVGLIFLLSAVVAIPTLVDYYSYYVDTTFTLDVLLAVLSVVSVLFVAAALLVKRLRGLLPLCFGLLTLFSAVLYVKDFAAMEAYGSLSYSYFPIDLLSSFPNINIVSLGTWIERIVMSPIFYAFLANLLLFFASLKEEGTRTTKQRIAIIVLSVLCGVIGATCDYVFPLVYLAYAAALVLTSLLLIPITFNIKSSLAKHIFLCLITFGVWYLIWVYNVTKHLNENAAQPRKPLAELLLYMFLPFYPIYWYYKTGELMKNAAEVKGKTAEAPLVSLIFASLIPFVASIITQNKLNEIVE